MFMGIPMGVAVLVGGAVYWDHGWICVWEYGCTCWSTPLKVASAGAARIRLW